MEGLDQRVVIVTGAGHGIGRVYCKAFAESGARVVAADIDLPAAQAAAADVVASGGESVAVAVDVADEAATRSMAAIALERFGRIDVLVNNAAIFATIPINRGSIESIDPVEWDRLMAVNLRGPFFCTRAVLPAMREQKSGKIVNISSSTVFSGSPGRIHYVTSKAGILGFTRTLAREVGEHNVQVNAVAPGSTLSEEHPSEQVIRMRQIAAAGRVLKRVQTPQDIVGAVLFLASSYSDFITGQTLVVDGGEVMN
jgi:3-oxoacyl-[acyl-carrier protein] reductase